METVLATGDEQSQSTISKRQLSMGQLKEQSAWKCERDVDSSWNTSQVRYKMNVNKHAGSEILGLNMGTPWTTHYVAQFAGLVQNTGWKMIGTQQFIFDEALHLVLYCLARIRDTCKRSGAIPLGRTVQGPS